MIHILTIHWVTDVWIDIQLKYFSEFLSSPYQTYAFLNRVPRVAEHRKKFNYTSIEEIVSHPIKLNLLADMACFNSNSDDDLLIFVDGDAFPIAPLDEFLGEKLKKHPLLAVQRLDNIGDLQPHPCFCVTTVRFWKKISGDWKKGSKPWINYDGNKVNDVGGAMLQKMNHFDVDWYKLNRSNTKRYVNKLLFGAYDNLVYHHGAGFRPPRVRADRANVNNFKRKQKLFKFVKRFFPESFGMKYFHPLRNHILENQMLSEAMFEEIKNNFDFYKDL